MKKRMYTPINRWLLLSLVVILVGVNVTGEDSSDSSSAGVFLNGRFWNKTSVDAQITFLLGFEHGVESAATNGNYKETVNAFYPSGFTNMDYLKEYMEGLNKLYSDRENILIPIPLAIHYCSLKLGGTLTNAQLEQKLIEMRKSASDLQEKKP